MLVDPVRGTAPLSIRSSHHGFARISSSHAIDVFQSSCTSWSSKIIATPTVENSQRITRVAPRLPVQARVLLEVGDLLARRQARVAPRADELARLGRVLVDVDLVADRQQQVRPLARGRARIIRSASAYSASTSRPRSSSSGLRFHGSLVRHGDAARAEHDLQRLAPGSIVRIALGGKSRARRAASAARRRARTS